MVLWVVVVVLWVVLVDVVFLVKEVFPTAMYLSQHSLAVVVGAAFLTSLVAMVAEQCISLPRILSLRGSCLQMEAQELDSELVEDQVAVSTW